MDRENSSPQSPSAAERPQPPLSAHLFAQLRRLDGRYSISASRRKPWPEAHHLNHSLTWLTKLHSGPSAAAQWWQSEHADLERSFELTLAQMESDPRNLAKLATLSPLEVKPDTGPPIAAELWQRAMAIESCCMLQFHRDCHLEWSLWQGAKPRVTAESLPMWHVSLLSRGSRAWHNYHVERPTLSEALRVAVERAPVAAWGADSGCGPVAPPTPAQSNPPPGSSGC